MVSTVTPRGSELDLGPDVLSDELWEVGDDLLRCRPRRHAVEDVVDPDTCTDEAGLLLRDHTELDGPGEIRRAQRHVGYTKHQSVAA